MKKLLVLLGVAAVAVAEAHECDKSLDDFPARPGEDDSARLQRAVDSTPEGSLYIPRGVLTASSTCASSNA